MKSIAQKTVPRANLSPTFLRGNEDGTWDLLQMVRVTDSEGKTTQGQEVFLGVLEEVSREEADYEEFYVEPDTFKTFLRYFRLAR